jgi:hypothetical protein
MNVKGIVEKAKDKKNLKITIPAIAVVAIVIVLIILLATGVFKSAKEKQDDANKKTTLVTVGDVKITAYDLDQFTSAYCFGSGYQSPKDYEGNIKSIKSQALTQLVNNQLTIAKLKEEKALPKDYKKTAKSQAEQNLKDEATEKRYEEFKVDMGGYEAYLAYTSILQPKLQEIISKQKEITDKEIKYLYKKNIVIKGKKAGKDYSKYSDVKESIRYSLQYSNAADSLNEIKDKLGVNYTKAGDKILTLQ